MAGLRRPVQGQVTSNVIRGAATTGVVVQAGVINLNGPLPQVTVPAQLRAPVRGFTGREQELSDVLGFLDPATTAGATVCVITGLPGAGKTELALQAGQAASSRGWFPGGVIYVDMHGYDDAALTAAHALDSALRALDVAAEDIPSEPEHRAVLYRSKMAAAAGAVLVVADNAADPEQFEPLVPGGAQHRVLVTSRHTLARPGARLVEASALTETEATALLDAAVRLASPGDSRITSDLPSAVRVAQMCGCLPLALQIAAALLKRDPGKPTTELAAELAAEPSRLRLLDDQHSAVLPVFDLSYRRLDSAAARLFRLLTVNPGRDVATRAVAVLADAPATDVRPILDGLADAHIIERLAVRDRWRMHDLVRVYARQRAEEAAASDGRDDARDRLLGQYHEDADDANNCLLADADGSDRKDGRFSDRPAALAWLESERLNLIAAAAEALAAGRPAIACDLAGYVTPFLTARMYLDDVLAVTETGLTAARDADEPSSEAALLVARGNALRLARRLAEAAEDCQQAAVISEEAGDQAIRAWL